MAQFVKPFQINVALASGPLRPARGDRTALILFAPAAGIVTVSPDNPAVNGVGIVMRVGDPPFIVDRSIASYDLGEAWRVIGTAVTTISVLDVQGQP